MVLRNHESMEISQTLLSTSRVKTGCFFYTSFRLAPCNHPERSEHGSEKSEVNTTVKKGSYDLAG